MAYTCEKLVPDEHLKNFLEELEYYWEHEKLPAKKIVEEMKEAYPFLETRHVYYFVKRYQGDKYGLYPRRRLKKKVEEETEPEIKIPYASDMPIAVVQYLRMKGLLVE